MHENKISLLEKILINFFNNTRSLLLLIFNFLGPLLF